uniref:Right handed beta helix domain-containing protein n=1 Tax=Rubrivivax gelatinosus S1 TaxID=1138313 RepID=L8BA43_RUBGE|nr:exported hypothetical protein [Rubrivivax gelatinosus S1]
MQPTVRALPIVLVLLAALPASALTIPVWPQADTREPGRVVGLAQAQQEARKALATLRAAGRVESVEVVLQPGRYALDAALVFGPEDSGSADAPTVWRAATPGTVLLSGARRLAPRAGRAAAGEAVFDAPALAPAFWAAAPQLFVGGRRAVLARQPDTGRFWTAGPPAAVPGEDPKASGRQAFGATPPMLAWVAGLDAADRARAVVQLMHSWTGSRHRLATPARPQTLQLQPPARWPFLNFGTQQRLWIENAVAAYDAPGEWIGGPDGVRYRLRPGEAMPAYAELPVAERLVVVRGAGPAGPYVEHLRLQGLDLAHTLDATPAAGRIDAQAGPEIGAAVEVDFARDFSLSDCRIGATGNYAVWLREGVRASTVERCDLQDLGGGGIKIGTAARTPRDAPGATGGNRVADNRIDGTGRRLPTGVGIWIGNSFGNVVEHNLVANTTYSGISVGWQWGYGEPSSGDNRIEANALLNIGNGSLSDLGGIYTLGRAPGTRIVGNLVREVRGFRGYGSPAFGIYNDEGSSELSVERNVVVGTDGGGYFLHRGRDLRVRGNLFAGAEAGEIVAVRSDPGRTRLVLEDNLILADTGPALRRDAAPGEMSAAGNRVAAPEAALAALRAACADGCRPVPASLRRGATLRALEVVGDDGPWNAIVAAAGPRPAALREPVDGLRPRPDPASSGPQQPPPAVEWSLDAAALPLRGQPPGWNIQPPNAPHTVGVVARDDAPDGRCLLLADSPSLASRVQPYLFVDPKRDGGRVQARFDLVIDADGDVVHEWRDAARPFATGPRLRITARGVEAAGRVVAPMTPGVWTRFEIDSDAGRGRWTLRVDAPPRPRLELRDLPFASPAWRSLDWFGFISYADVKTNACLADVRLRYPS